MTTLNEPTEVIVRPRGGGKTHDIIKWMRTCADREPRQTPVYVGFVHEQARNVWARVRDEGWAQQWQFTTFEELRRNPLRGRGPVVLCVDDADSIFASLLHHHVEVMSVSGRVLERSYADD